MMRQIQFVLIAIIALALIGAAVLSVQIIEQHDPKPLGEEPRLPSVVDAVPNYPRLSAPYAVLALDVSGSMVKADPAAMQLAAVLRFYELYRDLADETLGSEDTARIAVVLFATIPQVIAWDNNHNPWLAVIEENSAYFERTARRYLEPSPKDPRQGQFTDHAAAIQTITQLTSDLPSAPLVILMTDGEPVPFHPLTPLIPEKVRRDAVRAEMAELASLCDSAAAGSYSWLRAFGDDLIFDLTHRLQPVAPSNVLHPYLDADRIRLGVRQCVGDLVNLRFPCGGDGTRIPPYWVPLFLGDGRSEPISGHIQDVLAGQPNVEWGAATTYLPWLQERPFVHCQSPEDLISEYVAILAKWMRLKAVPLSSGATSFEIPSQTQSLAISLQFDRPADHASVLFTATSGSANHQPLHGAGTQWSGVVGDGPQAGTWLIQSGEARVLQGAVFLRPRFEWVFSMPLRFSKKTTHSSVDICLYSIEKRRSVLANPIFPNLPEYLTGTVAFREDNATQPLLFHRGLPGDTAAFRASLSPDGLSSGRAVITVDLAPLRTMNIVTGADVLRRECWIDPAIYPVLTDARRDTVGGMVIENVPSHSSLVRRIWSRISGSF